MRRPTRLLIAAVFGWGVSALAADVAALPEGHVWTRQDLERLYGPSSPASPAPRPEAEESAQNRLDAFLDRQYARLDAERALELQRREMYSRAEEARRTDHMSGHLLLAPYGYYGSSYYWGRHRPGGEHPVYPRPLPPPRPGLKPAGPGSRPPAWRGERGPRPGTPAGPYTRGRFGSS